MIPAIIAAASLVTALGVTEKKEEEEGPEDTQIPRKSSPVAIQWSRWRAFRTSTVNQALGTADLTIWVALGAENPERTGAPIWDHDKQQYSEDPSSDATGEDWLWFPATSDAHRTERSFEAAEAMGIRLAGDSTNEPMFADFNGDLGTYVDVEGSPKKRWSHPLQEKLNSDAALEMLKWGFNLAAIPDEPDSPYYYWYIVHPWPKSFEGVYPAPMDREKRDEEARQLMSKGKLFERRER